MQPASVRMQVNNITSLRHWQRIATYGERIRSRKSNMATVAGEAWSWALFDAVHPNQLVNALRSHQPDGCIGR